jgi:flagellar operon protein
MAKNINSLLIPNITKLPAKGKVDKTNELKHGQIDSDFKNMLQDQIVETKSKHGINLSVHAARRLSEREIEIDNNEFLKIKEAIGKLKLKGGHDSLVITNKAAYIVDVDDNKIVTAIDKNNIENNIFTKIDSTVIVQ